jgi:L-fuculokinase
VTEAIVVLDIGKTNKKVAVFDRNLKMIESRRRRIDAVERDGIRVEDVEQIEEWFLEQLTDLARLYSVRALTIATHGAAAVCVGEDGTPAVPPVDYTQPVEDSLHDRFFNEMGPAGELQVTTATTEVRPLINVGKSLFFLKERYPDRFRRIKHVLLFPQYFAYRLSGIATADITYAGCHSYLWDFVRGDWSRVADRLGIRGALPDKPVLPTETIGTITPEIAGRTGLSTDVIVTAGIHDSNASLLPYLITRTSDFVLNSSGTWCVMMHPTDGVAFAPDEVGKMVFYNLSYRGGPVKTSILMGGLEYDTYHQLLQNHHGRKDEPEPDLNIPLLKEIITAADTFVLPSVVKGSGQFPDSAARVVEPDREPIPLAAIQAGTALPEAFGDYERALALVNLSVAVQSVVALRRVGTEDGAEIFIEGGFRNNTAYLAILSALLPNNPIALTSVEEATSFGAALCGSAALEGRPVAELAPAVRMDIQRLDPVSLPGIDRYFRRFIELI